MIWGGEMIIIQEKSILFWIKFPRMIFGIKTATLF